MKDEKAWDYSICNIGHPCKECIKTCAFRLDNIGADKKEKKYERITKESKGTVKSNFNHEWSNYVPFDNE